MRCSSEGVPDRLLVVVTLLATLIAIGVPSSHAGDLAQSTTPWSGRDVFRNKGCAKCHSVHGEGGDEGPDLGEKRFYGTRLQLAALMWNHVPEMIEEMEEHKYEFPRLNGEEMGELITYLCYQRYAGDEGNERTGRKLLGKKNCVLCHTFGGEGGDIGPDISSSDEYLSPLKMVTSMWNHGPDMMPYFQEHGVKRPTFKQGEIVHLAAGIRSYMRPMKVPLGSHELGDAENGMVLVREKGCLHCHAVSGDGGDIAPDFTDLEFDCSVTEIAGRMWNHGPKMWESMKEENVAFPTLAVSEMADLLAYLFAIGLEDGLGNPEKGAHIVQKECSGCHAVTDGGVAPEMESVAGMKSPLEMIVAMWNHAPEIRKKQIEKHVAWPELNDRQMAHLFAYLKSIETNQKVAE